LPMNKQFEEVFRDFFIFYEPKDIVSGDFYWIKNTRDKCYFAVADCTGHGVPGAFVSMLGISFLNEILQTSSIQSAGDLLDQLRSKIKEALQQTGKKDETKDGMDISLAVFYPDDLRLEFAGANSHGIIIRDGKIIHLYADKMPIGIHGREQAFATQQIGLHEGDIIYLFSDGYMDQFGGKARRKFMSKNFRALLEEIHTLPMSQQQEKLKNVLIDWRGDCEQVDDITVIGLKISAC
jgi:serine phosphatase RsbU (regulator of sigma subunit)